MPKRTINDELRPPAAAGGLLLFSCHFVNRIMRRGFRDEDKDDQPNDEEHDQTQYPEAGVAGNLGSDADKQRACDCGKLAENIVEAEKLIGVLFWHQLAEIRAAQSLDAALAGGDHHRKYPEIQDGLDEYCVNAYSNIDENPDIQHFLARKPVSQFAVEDRKWRGYHLRSEQDDQ